MADRTALFPYPHVFDSQPRDGSTVAWPQACLKCQTRECERSKINDLAVCSYGYNYKRVNARMLIAGVVVRDDKSATPARQKRLREVGPMSITREQLDRSADTYKAFADLIDEEINAEKERLLRKYVNKAQYETEFLQLIKPDLQRGLALVHDYSQINRQISQNINDLVMRGYEGASLPEKLAHAKPAERAIYEASKYLEEKLTVAKFLSAPEWLEQRDPCRRFRLHGLVTKYLHIYHSVAERKRLKVKEVGSSYHEIEANPQAVGVIAHTFIDNAIKYSPPEGEIEIALHDHDELVDFSVTSWGPHIKQSEEERIFDLFYRGTAATKLSEDGSGYGLYVSQLVARKHLGTEITVDQQRSLPVQDRFKTTFSVGIPLRAAILR